MTHNAVKEVANYCFSSKDKLFLDTNIWLFFYGPQNPRNHWVNIYSQAFSRILAAKSSIYIDVLIVSEFINTYARQQWEFFAPEGQKFKDFRRSSDFRSIAHGISSDVRRVLQYCSRVDSSFDSLSLDDLLYEYGQGDTDFNDQVIAELCRSKGLTVITNDGDFGGRDVSILTANRRLL